MFPCVSGPMPLTMRAGVTSKKGRHNPPLTRTQTLQKSFENLLQLIPGFPYFSNHGPSCGLPYTKIPRQSNARHSLARYGRQQNSVQPFMQRYVRPLQHGTKSNSKLPVASLTAMSSIGSHMHPVPGLTSGADWSLRPETLFNLNSSGPFVWKKLEYPARRDSAPQHHRVALAPDCQAYNSGQFFDVGRRQMAHSRLRRN
jgi:hypothetical protein